MTTKYAEFDVLLLEKIGYGYDTMHRLEVHSALVAAAMPFRNFNGRTTDTFRVIDRRLQALRKAGKIIFTRTGWQIVV